jgi:hypothetical protein
LPLTGYSALDFFLVPTDTAADNLGETMNTQEVLKLFDAFALRYAVEEKNAIWQSQSQQFRNFWNKRILPGGKDELSDAETDDIIRILDRNGKGNTAATEAVARAMTPQGAWRRMFNQIKSDQRLAQALNETFTESDTAKRATAIDKVYKINEGRRNNLTGQSGNAINCMLAAHDPFANSSVISLKDRRKVIEYLGIEDGPDFDKDAIGKKMALSNVAISNGFKKLGFAHNARTMSVFLYSPEMKPLWKVEQEEGYRAPEVTPQPHTVARPETGDIALFYMESQLEDFLIENWDKTELGTRYDLIEEEGELVSQQYRTGIGIIDILAQDKKTKQFVVIELKKDQTSDDTIGQLTRYMGWLEEHKTNGSLTKGIIIAAQYDTRLHYALKKVKDVEVYLYRVSFKLDEFRPH